MIEKIIILVDLGHFRAYKVSKGAMDRSKIELIESFDNIDAHSRLGDKLSDKAGKFSIVGGKSGTGGFGEPHHLESEIEKRLIKSIAKDINALLNKVDCRIWDFAAGKKINHQIFLNQKKRML